MDIKSSQIVVRDIFDSEIFGDKKKRPLCLQSEGHPIGCPFLIAIDGARGFGFMLHRW
jgi:hypothetical protein